MTTEEQIEQLKKRIEELEGVKGEFYPCKPDIFEETYEQIN